MPEKKVSLKRADKDPELILTQSEEGGVVSVRLIGAADDPVMKLVAGLNTIQAGDKLISSFWLPETLLDRLVEANRQLHWVDPLAHIGSGG